MHEYILLYLIPKPMALVYFEHITHDSALPSDKYGGQIGKAHSPEHATGTA